MCNIKILILVISPNRLAAVVVACLDNVQARLASHKGMISLWELQSATGEEEKERMNSVQEFEVAKSVSSQYTRSIFSRR